MAIDPSAGSTEAFLDEVFAAAFVRLEEGAEVDVEAFVRRRPDLRGAILAAVLTARQARPQTAAAGAHAAAPLPGYEIIRPLGRGGMGTVYLARQTALEREVALKVLPAADALSPRARQRFASEARALARVQHAHVVQVHDVIESQHVCAFAMELVRGASLAELLAAACGSAAPDARLGAARSALAAAGTAASEAPARDRSWVHFVLRVGCEIADALTAVHAQGLVHRDVKPSNVLVRADGAALLSDFGLVRDAEATALTGTGQFLGTLAYAAPEQLRGQSAEVDARTDVYALGVTLYHALSLRLPFVADHPSKMLARIAAGAARPLRSVDRSLPRDLALVVARAMDPDPARRYPTAAALARDLRNVIELRPIDAQPAGLVLRLRRWRARHPAPAAALLVALLVAAGGSAVFAVTARSQARRAQVATDRLLVTGLLDQVPTMLAGGSRRVAAMEQWLALARATLAQREQHEGLRAAIERAGVPADPVVAAAGRERDERAAAVQIGELGRVAYLEKSFRNMLPEPNSEWLMQYAQVLRSRHEQMVAPASRPALAFARVQDGELSALLCELKPLIDRLAAAEAMVAERLAAARRSHEIWDAARTTSWPVACRDARMGNGAAALTPQADLIPLGPDPVSGLQEFAHLPTGTPPVRDPDTGVLRFGEACGLVLVLIPGGTVRVGAVPPADGETDGVDHRDRDALDSEQVTTVALAPFFLSKFEMTQAQWQRVTGRNPSWSRPGTEVGGRTVTAMHPVEMVTREEAGALLRSLGLCLPTDAQWECACRAGTTTRHWSGSQTASLEGAENLDDAPSALRAGRPRADVMAAGRAGKLVRWDDGWLGHAPVGTFRANPFGLFDMHGNVSELCQDFFPSPGTPQVFVRRPGDGLASLNSAGWQPVHRGGSFRWGIGLARSSARYTIAPGLRDARLGVRPARVIE